MPHTGGVFSNMTPTRPNSYEVAIIGAGPYGLSVAAHLKAAGIAARVFGEPMAFWRNNMPKGMLLRSPWSGTRLSNPDNTLSLDAYAASHDISPQQRLPLERFVAYGEWFQRNAVPDVDRRSVRTIDAAGDGFRLTFDDGDAINTGRVVIATGLRHQEYRPAVFRDLPADLVSHTGEHTDLSKFFGKRVAVIGRGQSACESAALLAEAGAETDIISNGGIHWLGIAQAATHYAHAKRHLLELLKSPSEVGPFPIGWLSEVPGLTHYLPANIREALTRRCLKPAASGWLRPRFNGITVTAGTITGIRAHAGGVALDCNGSTSTFDHVLLGTGYQIDLARLGFFAPRLLEKISCADGSPRLRADFESSVPRLHFVGSYAVKSFGPLLRFIAGAPFAARTVTAAVQRTVTAEPANTYSTAADLYDTTAAQPWPPR
ncbi:MAG TPA: NAD(P)-binding domain-containing protein [Xanthobacteraceae bacterium]|jgi:cation diffusion facilitator CzcD-associated flavoprotein CzcO|nr:NAD(P)-binding domain-containing protein [Xanthobacteraceae bacterium]